MVAQLKFYDKLSGYILEKVLSILDNCYRMGLSDIIKKGDFDIGFSQGDLIAIKYETNGNGEGEIKDLSITLIGYYD